ncbi:NmrA/HSCARG family protein [Mycobacterium cookii]|uniref:Nucleotide-diphosphate-sugar epimerase n=1 Tax=Mycobacterium cookii TaxID=1775 RepID=A0A7I7L389_9MYCO|nr:NmrA/HSCARG family protein [Mycobacterium cookii]MCV7329616.1 NmrA/HSCARG family protein [Mycobacterium cookii]BBX48544.1 nucleotide-diphosphate-sugar epimerase [Mycobacterium cookii]
MNENKRIAVVGATGTQGGGLVRAILADAEHEYAARALTRNANSANAQALTTAGAEVVEANLDDEVSMRKAFDGAHGAFVVTAYFAVRSPEDESRRTAAEMELEQAEVAARAAKDAGVAHLVWSTLEDTRTRFANPDEVPTLEGRYKVPHFDAKAEADEIFVRYGVPTTFLRTSFFFENLFMFPGFGPVRAPSGELVLALPMADQPVPGIAVDDIGKSALGIFKRGPELIGKTVSIAGDHLTGDGYAAALTEALGEKVSYRPVSWDEFRTLPFPGAVEMGNMFQYFAEDSERYSRDRDLAVVRELNPELQSFRDWLAVHKDQIPRDSSAIPQVTK